MSRTVRYQSNGINVVQWTDILDRDYFRIEDAGNGEAWIQSRHPVEVRQ